MMRLLFLALFGLGFLQPALLSDSPLLYTDVVDFIHKASNPEVIPITKKDHDPVEIGLTLMLIHISEVKPENNEMEVIAWLAQEWQNPALAWEPSTMGNATTVRVPSPAVWTPDLGVFNGVHEVEEVTPHDVVIMNDGHIKFVPSLRISFICDLEDIDSYSVTCGIKIGSWTYSGKDLTLREPKFDLSEYQKSKYEVISATAEKKVEKYSCCPDLYESARFEITFRKKEKAKKSPYMMFNFH